MPPPAVASEPPGIRWGPFTLRLPLIHHRIEAPEALQGILVACATGMAVVPLYIEHFAMSFETAIAMVVVQSVFVAAGFWLFGDPFCPGWLTPALPLVLREALAFSSIDARIDFVNAVVLDVAVLFLILGATGLSSAFVRAVPSPLKAAIILGAGISAILGEITSPVAGGVSRVETYPVTISLAVGLTLVLLFSRPFEAWKKRSKAAAGVAVLGIAPGFFLAMLVGPVAGEISWSAFRLGDVLFRPDFATLLSDYSVLGRGVPSLAVLLSAAPVALAAYTIGFGDLITGTAIVEEAAAERGDQHVSLDARRTHLAVGLRNALTALFGGPFFPLQGPLWAGATVVVCERFRQGRSAMQSIFSGVGSYYLGVPFYYFVGPVLELLRPLMGVALSMTLLLTGFACAYVGLRIPRDRVERGVVLLAAMGLAHFSTAVGLAAGLALTFALLGPDAWRQPPRQPEG